MKSFILLLILGFIQSAICCSEETNRTQNESELVCPISWFRRKRALEYTRWRANEETSPQFLVKVLDDEIPTANTKKVVAVNIHPNTQKVEKIIIGGAAVPPSTPVPISTDGIKDYTRFVPPTTVPPHHPGDVILPGPVARPPPIQKERHPLRDESPPAGPHFLTRTQPEHQYAPVAPVSFTKRTTHSPLTPPTVMEHNYARITGGFIPTRTSLLPDISVPTRTEFIPDQSTPYPAFDDAEHNLLFMTRTTFVATFSPIRTTSDKLNDDFPEHNSIHEDDSRRFESKQKSEKELDAIYNMMFYDDETDARKGDVTTEVYDEKDKHEESSTAYDFHKDHDHGGNDLTESDDIHITKEEFIADDNPSTNMGIKKSTDVHVYDMDDKYNNITLLESSRETPSLMQLKNRFQTKLKSCNLIKIRSLDFNSPRSLYEIVAQLKRWAENSPVAKWVDITNGNYTTLDNPIYMMIVDDPTSGQVVSAKHTVMIVAGIQGRDHHAVAAAMYLLYQLIERTSTHSDLLSKYRFWVIPVFNPDGYDYSSTFPQRRDWIKNLRQTWNLCKHRASCQTCRFFGLGCTVEPCYGVNLDRNFEYQWIPYSEESKSEDPCGPLYAGTRQLSEPETQALTQFLHRQRVPLFTFITYKEGDVLGVMYPYSHTKKRRALDYIYRQRATLAASAANSISGRHYVAGQTSEYLPLYAGGIEDWIDGHLGVDNTYTIMLFRPSESFGSKFLTERVVHEGFAAVDTLLLQSIEPYKEIHSPVSLVSRINRNAVSRCVDSTALVFLGILVLMNLG